jgi:anti-sigma B factor antagonist
LDINLSRRSEVQLVQLKDALRMGEAVDGLRLVFEASIGHGEVRFVMDLAEVPMIDSSGIGLLVRCLASTRQRAGNVKLVNPSKFALQTMRLVGVLNLFEVFDTDEAALQSYQ